MFFYLFIIYKKIVSHLYNFFLLQIILLPTTSPPQYQFKKNIYKLQHLYTIGGSGDKLLLNSHTPCLQALYNMYYDTNCEILFFVFFNTLLLFSLILLNLFYLLILIFSLPTLLFFLKSFFILFSTFFQIVL